MALSHHEQRALVQIAVELYTDDPWLASTLAHSGWTKPSRRQRIAAAAMFLAGMAMLGCAILIPRSVTGGLWAASITGYFVMFEAALLWCRGSRPRRRRDTFISNDADPEA